VRKYSEKLQSRREMLAGALRYAALGLMASTSAALFIKRRRLVQQGLCINSGICAGCEILENCGLPLAVSARQDLMGANNGKE
jgi:hypothetical protein